MKKTKYLNPYISGTLLGLVLLTAIYISGRGLGSSGAVKSVVVTAVQEIAPAHADNGVFYQKYKASHPSPLKSWLVFEMLGVIIGAFLSGLISNRLTFSVEKSPLVKSRTRLLLAFGGGMLFAIGAQFARGCTSGAALSGMAVMATSGFITMIAIFGTGYLFAYFFRKYWNY
jgi:uncharacterized protein